MSEQDGRPEPALDMEHWDQIEAHQLNGGSEIIIFDTGEPRRYVRGPPVALRR